jgi:nicotinic acid mononucleotide adenylyltransferase
MVISKRKCIILDNKLTVFLADSKRQLITLEIPNSPTLIEKVDVINAISIQFKIERKYVELSVQDVIALPMSTDGVRFEELYIVKVDDVCNIKKLQYGSSLLLSYALNSFQIEKFEVSEIEKKFLRAVYNRFRKHDIDNLIHLGGAFSPWGKHHSGILLSLVEKFRIKNESFKIVICPSSDTEEKTKISFKLRKAIIEDVIEELCLSPFVDVSDINIGKEKTTYEIVNEFEYTYNFKNVYVVLGQDNLDELYWGQWENGDKLLAKENLHIIGIPRNFEIKKKDIVYSTADNFEILDEDVLKTYTNSSSSLIRKYILEKKFSIVHLLVHSSTCKYLKDVYDEVYTKYNK